MRLERKPDSNKLVLAVLMILAAIPIFCETILVPEEYSTIQSGIDAAGNGDTVIVAPDTYFENINFRGKSILLTSYFIYDTDTQFINNTVIDGSTYTNSDSASTVSLCNGENESSILQGFTITGGSGTAWVDPQLPNLTWYSGGGVFIYYASPTIRNNMITSNIVSNDGSFDGASGGGLLCFRGNPLICNNTFSANQADYGAGLVTDYSGARIMNNLIIYNSGGQQYGGGGIYTIGTHTEPVLICNNVVYGNHSMTTGGAIQLWSSITAKNNILWANTQNSGGPISGNPVNITYSVIENGYAGEGNISLPPQIIDFLTFQIDPASPCVDTGNPDVEYNDPEDPDSPGEALYPSQGSVRNDMGAYGGPYSSNWELTSAEENILDIQEHPFNDLKAFPNPFNPCTTISFLLSMESKENSELDIFNIKGQRIKTFTFRKWSLGTNRLNNSAIRGGVEGTATLYSITWDGTDDNNHPVPSGVYFYTLNASGYTQSKKMILLK